MVRWKVEFTKWERPKSNNKFTKQMYYNIESDSSEYSESDEDNDDGDVTGEDLLEVSTEENQDAK